MTLAVCATPIGNLEDVTLRVLQELAEADVVLCEDTRHTARLLDRHGIRATRLLSYHRHNEAARTAEVLERLRGRGAVALVSDAGLPGINDPGVRLVGAAREAGLEVTVLPGASAVTTALVASGFQAERYQFLGFLPRGARGACRAVGRAVTVAARRRRIRVATAAARVARVARGALPERPVAVCRELTKRFEEVVRGRPPRWPRGSPSHRRARSSSCSGRPRCVARRRRARRDRARARRGRHAAARAAELVAGVTTDGVSGAVPLSPLSVGSVDNVRPGRYCGLRSHIWQRKEVIHEMSSAWPRGRLRARGRSRGRGWTWPADGPVLQAFAVGADPYAGGQHRGVDIGCGAGEAVRAPVARPSVVRGDAPAYGHAVTIRAVDGWGVTLLHVGDARGRARCGGDRGATRGLVGPTGEAEHEAPYGASRESGTRTTTRVTSIR